MSVLLCISFRKPFNLNNIRPYADLILEGSYTLGTMGQGLELPL